MKTTYYILVSIIFFFFGGCKDRKKEDITHLVKEWQGKTIQFPSNSIFTQFATDTVDYRIPESPYKVLIYVDSIGCTTCKLQLPKWKEFMKQVDSISNHQVAFIFFFYPKDNKEIRYILKRDRFDQPVCIDREDRLNRLNRFPANTMFQTFLLDKDNKVCLIGNPIHNLAIQDLYLKQIQSLEEIGSVINTQIQTESQEYDMGYVSEGSEKEMTITLTNVGNHIFYMRGATTSCECTEVFYDWKEIPAYENKQIKVRYKAEQSGDFLRTITIYGNIPEKSLTLTFIGTVQ